MKKLFKKVTFADGTEIKVNKVGDWVEINKGKVTVGDNSPLSKPDVSQSGYAITGKIINCQVLGCSKRIYKVCFCKEHYEQMKPDVRKEEDCDCHCHCVMSECEIDCHEVDCKHCQQEKPDVRKEPDPYLCLDDYFPKCDGTKTHPMKLSKMKEIVSQQEKPKCSCCGKYRCLHCDYHFPVPSQPEPEVREAMRKENARYNKILDERVRECDCGYHEVCDICQGVTGEEKDVDNSLQKECEDWKIERHDKGLHKDFPRAMCPKCKSAPQPKNWEEDLSTIIVKNEPEARHFEVGAEAKAYAEERIKQMEYTKVRLNILISDLLARERSQIKEKVERLKLEVDVVVCDCGEPYRNSDLAGLIDELLEELEK